MGAGLVSKVLDYAIFYWGLFRFLIWLFLGSFLFGKIGA
jgi:hypothetical protein